MFAPDVPTSARVHRHTVPTEVRGAQVGNSESVLQLTCPFHIHNPCTQRWEFSQRTGLTKQAGWEFF